MSRLASKGWKMNNEVGAASVAPLRPGRPAVLAFEQQPKESNKAFAAFKIYLDLGPRRSLAAVAKKLGQSKCMPERWSRRYGWQARVLAWDAHFADLERQAIEQMAVEKAVEWWKLQEPTRRQAWQEAEHAIAMVKQAREQWQKSGRTPGFEGIARLLELAFRL